MRGNAFVSEYFDGVREALKAAALMLRSFRSYYISDHRLGGEKGQEKWRSNTEIQRCDVSLALCEEALR